MRLLKSKFFETHNVSTGSMPFGTCNLKVKVRLWELPVHPPHTRETWGVISAPRAPDNFFLKGSTYSSHY